MNKVETIFFNIQEPTMSELIHWFLVNYPVLASDMKNSYHEVQTDEPNPYHIEGDIFAHTMMVCQRAEIASETDYSKVNLICALLHDIGKPEAREVIDFKVKKPVHAESNTERNKVDFSDSVKVIPKSGKKVHLRGHEGLSFYKAIRIVNELQEEGVITQEEKQGILTIVSIHGTLFDSIGSEGEMKKESKVFDKFKDINLFNSFITQVKCDSLGRFFVSKDGRKNHATRLGTEIFTQSQFIEYHKENPRDNKPNDNAPVIRVLVGCPGSGKSQFINTTIYKNSILEIANEFKTKNN